MADEKKPFSHVVTWIGAITAVVVGVGTLAKAANENWGELHKLCHTVSLCGEKREEVPTPVPSPNPALVVADNPAPVAQRDQQATPQTAPVSTPSLGPAPVHDCDRLAQPLRDAMGRVPALVEGVEMSFDSPRSQIRSAQQACERAMAEWPNEARFISYAARVSFQTRNENQTLRLSQRAADMRHPIGMVILGLCRRQGRCGATRNDAVAVQLFRAAMDLGYTDARIFLAFMYEGGRGVEQNYQEAVRLLRTAMDLNSPSAPGQLARYYEDGIGVSRDQNEAIRLLRISASRGSMLAKERLAAKNVSQ